MNLSLIFLIVIPLETLFLVYPLLLISIVSVAMRIRIGFSANPDPTFYLNSDPDPGSQTNANPDPGQTLPSQKAEF